MNGSKLLGLLACSVQVFAPAYFRDGTCTDSDGESEDGTGVAIPRPKYHQPQCIHKSYELVARGRAVLKKARRVAIMVDRGYAGTVTLGVLAGVNPSLIRGAVYNTLNILFGYGHCSRDSEILHGAKELASGKRRYLDGYNGFRQESLWNSAKGVIANMALADELKKAEKKVEAAEEKVRKALSVRGAADKCTLL